MKAFIIHTLLKHTCPPPQIIKLEYKEPLSETKPIKKPMPRKRTTTKTVKPKVIASPIVEAPTVEMPKKKRIITVRLHKEFPINTERRRAGVVLKEVNKREPLRFEEKDLTAAQLAALKSDDQIIVNIEDC